MDAPRSSFATDPRLFGRRVGAAPINAVQAEPNSISDDLRLFGLTFAAGFLFMSVFLG